MSDQTLPRAFQAQLRTVRVSVDVPEGHERQIHRIQSVWKSTEGVNVVWKDISERRPSSDADVRRGTFDSFYSSRRGALLPSSLLDRVCLVVLDCVQRARGRACSLECALRLPVSLYET